MPARTQAKRKKKMIRIPKSGGKLGGVSIAFARYFNIDVTLIRILWVLLALPGGLPGIIPYLICYLLIPHEGE